MPRGPTGTRAPGSARLTIAPTPIRAIRAQAFAVQHKRVIGNGEAVAFSNFTLALLDQLIIEFVDFAAGHTHDMIVVLAAVKLKDRLRALEVMSGDETGRFELGEHPVHRGEADFFTGVQQRPIDVFGAQMARRIRCEDLENLHSRQGDLQACLLEVLSFHRRGLLRAAPHRQAITRDPMRRFPNSMPIYALRILRRCDSQRKAACALSLLLTLAGTSGCAGFLSPQKLTIQQGNILTQEQVDGLAMGMSRQEVIALLGQPILSTPFHTDRLDYVFVQRTGSDKPERRHLHLRLQEGMVVAIDGQTDGYPVR